MRTRFALFLALGLASGCSLVVDVDGLQGGDAGQDLGTPDLGVDTAIADLGVDVGCGPLDTVTQCGACGRACSASNACVPSGSSYDCMPVDCAGVKADRETRGVALTDGAARIDPDGAGAGTSFFVHCHGLATASPAAYLDVTPSDVWSRYANATDCTGSAKYLVRRFSKVRLRIDPGPPVAYATDTSDYTFTNVEFLTVDGQPSNVNAFRTCAGSSVDMDPAIAQLGLAYTCGGGGLASVRFPETGFRVAPATVSDYVLYPSTSASASISIDADGLGFAPTVALGTCGAIGPSSLDGVVPASQRLALERTTGATSGYGQTCAAALRLAAEPSPLPTEELPRVPFELRVLGGDTVPANTTDCSLPTPGAVRWVRVEIPPNYLADLEVSTASSANDVTVRVFDQCGGTCVAAAGTSNAYTTTISNPSASTRTVFVAVGIAGGSGAVTVRAIARP